MGKWRLKLVLLLTLLNIIGILTIIPYEYALMSKESPPGNLPNYLIIVINSITQVIYMFLMILIGLRLQKRTGLNTSILNGLVYPEYKVHISKKGLINSIGVALMGSLIVVLLDVFIFSPLIGDPIKQLPSPNWWQGLLASIYGGITEEILLRLFGMTLIVWLLARITKKKGDSIPNSFYWIAILFTSLLFGIGHLPATAQVFDGLSGMIVIRTLVLNGILGLWFGYVYWKRGLEYAIIAHMSADIFIHALITPLFY